MKRNTAERLLCLALLVCAVSVEVGIVHYEAMEFKLGHTKEQADEAILQNMYPVIVVTYGDNGKCTASWKHYSMLDDIKNSGIDYSFTIPKGMESELRSQIEKSSEPCTAIGPSTFNVNRHPDGTQSITAFYSWHGGLNCDSQWYIAGFHKIIPQYVAAFMLMPILAQTVPVVAIISFLVWMASRVIFGRIWSQG